MTAMNRSVFRKNLVASFVSGLVPLAFTIAVIGMILVGLRQAEESSRAEGLRLLEEAIMRAAVHSYAVSGHFPESLSYISENYGIFIDTDRFIVHYDASAMNLLPNIRVFELSR